MNYCLQLLHFKSYVSTKSQWHGKIMCISTAYFCAVAIFIKLIIPFNAIILFIFFGLSFLFFFCLFWFFLLLFFLFLFFFLFFLCEKKAFCFITICSIIHVVNSSWSLNCLYIQFYSEDCQSQHSLRSEVSDSILQTMRKKWCAF